MGAFVMTGYLAYEAIIFGLPLWFAWNFFKVGPLLGLDYVTYFQAVAILFIIKILRFDSAKMSQQQPVSIVIPKESPKESKE
jgi:hypothetical protein